MSLVTITIDGENYKVKDKNLLMDTLIKNGIKIPSFCYHEAVGADGNCRMCMVEIVGQKRPQIACDTFVKDGMVVKTSSPKVNDVRKDILELELINHPVDCPVCDQAGECSLQDFYMDYGLYDNHIEKKEKNQKGKKIDLGRNVIHDQERCVLCTRCTRFTTDITKTNELGVINRGDHACISAMPGRGLTNDYAMNIVDLCPVGAMTSKDFRFSQRVWFLKTSPSICHGCDKGCNIDIDHNKEKYKDDAIHRIRPRINRDINGHFMCDFGRLTYKDLQENRQEVSTYTNKELSETQTIEYLSKINFKAKNVVVLVDANLYIEDMAMIASFAKGIDAKLVAPLDVYYDEEFGDDWLKSSWKCANKAALKDFQISSRLEDKDTKDIDLLINFNHPDFAKYEAKQTISFQTHKNFEADLILPIPAYTEYPGTIMNSDGVKQYCQQVINRNNPIRQIASWIELIRKEIL